MNPQYEKLKSKLVKHSVKIGTGVAVVASTASQTSAMSASDIANGTALFNAGVGVAQTEPLSTIIALIGVAIGAIVFIGLVKKLYR